MRVDDAGIDIIEHGFKLLGQLDQRFRRFVRAIPRDDHFFRRFANADGTVNAIDSGLLEFAVDEQFRLGQRHAGREENLGKMRPRFG